MKFVIILFCLFLISLVLSAQPKATINSETFNSWPLLKKDIILSGNGRFTAFTISNLPKGSNTLVIQDVMSNWKREIISEQVNSFYFTTDSKYLCWQKGDSIFLASTRGNDSKLISVATLYKFPALNKGEWIIFREREKDNGIVLLNLISGRRLNYPFAVDIRFDDLGLILLVASEGPERTIQLVDLHNLKSKVIYSLLDRENLTESIFDWEKRQLAFTINGPMGISVYHITSKDASATKIVDDQSPLLNGKMTINRLTKFSNNGNWLFLQLKQPIPYSRKRNPELASVDIWDYRDVVLYPERSLAEPMRSINSPIYIVIKLDSIYIQRLVNPDALRLNTYDGGDYVILSSDTLGSQLEYWWPHKPQPSHWLMSLNDGTRRLLIKEKEDVYPRFSPRGRWVTWWDKDVGSWFTYEVATGKFSNICENIPVSFISDQHVDSGGASMDKNPVGMITGWNQDESELLVYDNFDVWKVNLASRKSPINITGGFGRKNQLKLRLVSSETDAVKPNVYRPTEKLLLIGYNQQTKHNGFLLLDQESRQLEVLCMTPSTWYRVSSQAYPAGMLPVEGGVGLGHGWVVMNQNPNNYPNYYYTKKFQTFKQLTNLQPQSNFNWLTVELVKWRLPDGRMSQGVLYKPEDFDSTMRYPVIFNYYEKNSHKIYEFPYPGLTYSNINIPYFVSRGYLVFRPDIYFGNSSITGQTSGRYACNAVESAVAELIKRPYIDSNRLGLQGHSFGGLETNYIITHSNKFAAAAENAGFTDVMSSYLTLTGYWMNNSDFISTQAHKERDHELYGSTPWERPDLYLDNSPVWAANNVLTPLLICHNKKDNQVQWRQGIEMYMALRRLAKPCWMLQYDDSKHVLEPKDAFDYTIRLTQFFDHYLKELPAPRWMTEGIDPELKQIVNKFDLDIQGNCGRHCKVCKRILEKENATKKRALLPTN